MMKQPGILLSLDECKELLRRGKEVERAKAVGRHKESDKHMKGYVDKFGSVLEFALPELSLQRRLHLAGSLPLHSAIDFQRAVAKEMQMQQASADKLSLEELLNLQTRNQAKEDDACPMVPLEDALNGARARSMETYRGYQTTVHGWVCI